MSLADDLAGVAKDEPVNKGSIDLTPDGATVNNVVVDTPIFDDWTPVFELFKLDATVFEVVDDTVRCSTWQQSARTADGDRDIVQLYSYSARFRRVTRDVIPQATVDAWRTALIQDRPTGPEVEIAPASDAGTYLMLVADPQLGKKGTEEAVENWKRGVTGHLNAAKALGSTVSRIHVAFMGDETENVVNSYGNQPHTIELNRSQQLELDFDMRVWTFKEAAKLGLGLSASSVWSNHGLWTRNGGKDPVTTHSDNASTHIARQTKKLFDELAPFGGPQIDWTIGDVSPGVQIELSGVECYFSHGYIEKGRGGSSELRTKSAIERQILGKTEELGTTSLWLMAHYHHYYSQEFEGRTLFGCPALEAEKSSEYMLDQYGVWSPPGMLGMVVGSTHDRGWSNLNVF